MQNWHAKSKEEILHEFVRLFLANSMELEGSTITPSLAKDIDRKKKVMLPEADVVLYNNSRRALLNALTREFRSVVSFRNLHREIYDGIFPHAGEFKKNVNTFGYLEKAVTSSPIEVREHLQEVLEGYRAEEVYSFLKPLLFHLRYQKTSKTQTL